MDYMYGNLQHQVEKVEYTGKASPTAVVLIDPRENTIAVDVKPLSPSILSPQTDFINDGKRVLVATTDNTHVSYTWTTIEEATKFLQEQIDKIDADILEYDVNESQYRERIALVLDSLQKQIDSEAKEKDDEITALHEELNAFELTQGQFNEKVSIFINTTDGTLQQLYDTLNQEIKERKEADIEIHEELNQFEITQNQINEDTSRNIEAIDGTLKDMIERDACFVSVDINEDYTVTVSIYNNDKELLDSGTINIPLASVIVKAEYDEDTKCIILYLADGSVLTIPVGDIISGLAKQGAVDKEIYDREQADTTLQNNINTETNSRISADRALLSTINSSVETLNEVDKDLQTQITAEVEARESADTALQKNIDDEASTRESTDKDLQGQLGAEISEREEADATLQSNINAEETARKEADNTLQENIDKVAVDLEMEVNTRTENDATTFTMKLDHDTYVLTFELLNAEGKRLKFEYVDFPEEILIMDMTYDSDTKTIVITLRNNEKRYIPLNDLVSGLVTTATFDSWVATIESEIATWEGLLTNETEARTNADTALNSLVTTISDNVSSQISNIETRLTDGIGTATTQATNAAESAKQAQEAAKEAEESAETALSKVNELDEQINGTEDSEDKGLAGDIAQLQEEVEGTLDNNYTDGLLSRVEDIEVTLNGKEDEETGEKETGLVEEVVDIQANKTSIKIKDSKDNEEYISIPELYFDGEITRNTEEEIEQVTIILNCGGAN